MAITLATPSARELDGVVDVLGDWQVDGGPVQLHPGDLGWFRRFGADAAVEAVRTWSRHGRLLAIGLLDGPDLLRLAFAADAEESPDLVERMCEDLVDVTRGVLVSGTVSVESPPGSRLHDALGLAGWDEDDPWTLLRRDLRSPVEPVGLATEVVGPDVAPDWAAVHQSAFDSSTPALERWHAMAAGRPFDRARCILGRNAQGDAVAAVTVWSAGRGRPGLVEPMGVHRGHRGHGYGRAITLAGAAALKDLGSSAVVVATPSANVGAVATYRSAGLDIVHERRDRCRKHV